jgi:hypothetical protein
VIQSFNQMINYNFSGIDVEERKKLIKNSKLLATKLIKDTIKIKEQKRKHYLFRRSFHYLM